MQIERNEDEERHNAKTALMAKKKGIEENKPKPKQVGEYVITLQPFNDKDLKTIKYYNPGKLTKKVKGEFGKYLKKPESSITLGKGLPTSQSTGAELGIKWDQFLSKRIDKDTTRKNDAADSLFDYLKEKFKIDLFVSHMQLYGYMYSEGESSPQVYYWDGDADAVGWYYNKDRKQYEYVIVDWKVVDLLDYWKSSSAYGKHLHQCLVYAKLLQLHLNLDYLPSILIVPISKYTGEDVHPGLFRDYPDECESFLDEQLVWSIEQPEPPQYICAEFPFNPKLPVGVVDEEMLLKDLFAKGAKVKDLLEAFDFNGLKVITE